MSAGVVVKDRKKALLLLAGSRHDLAPGPKVGQAFRHGKAAPTRKDVCLLCDGDRVVRDRFGRESACESCKGLGWHKVDPMLNKQAGSWEEQKLSATGTRRVMCDRCAGAGVWKGARCEMCDGSGKVSVPIVRAELADNTDDTDVVLNEWERMLERREASGSYREFDKCMDRLEREYRHGHRVFNEVHVLGVASAGWLSGTQADMLALAIAKLLAWMPREIVVPRGIAFPAPRNGAVKGKGVSNGQRGARDQEIVQCANVGGETAQALAARMRISVRQVQRVLDAAG
jgi:hypothetical protein